MPKGSSPVGNLPNDPYLQKEFYEPEIYRRVSRALAPLIEFLPKVEADAEAIVAIREMYSAATDPQRRYPALHVAGAEFPRVTISGLEEIATVIAEEGLEFAISPRARRWATGITMIDRTFQRVSWWLADYLTMKMFTNLKGYVTETTGGMSFYDRSKVAWGAEGANPVKDLRLIQDDMEDFDMDFTVTDFYVARDGYRALLAHLVDLDIDVETRRNLFGMPEARSEEIFIPMVGATVHKVKYGLDEGAVLALDMNNRPATLYYGRNPEFAPTERWETEEGEVMENNLGLHSHAYFEDRTHDEIRQLWFEHAVLVTEPMAGIYVPPGAKGIF